MGPITHRTKEHLVVTDVGIIEMRRLLLTLAMDLCEGKEPSAARKSEAYYGVRGVSLVRQRGVSLDECVEDAMKQIAGTRSQVEKLRSRA